MKIRAGFAQIDITPQPGTHKIGWLRDIVGYEALDPLFARAAAFECGGAAVGFIQLDLLSIRWTQVDRIRRRIAEKHGFAGANILVAATHNHAGPAVANVGDVRRDEAYIAELEDKCVSAFGAALNSMAEAQVGFG